MKHYGINAINTIEENPYILIDITYGVDFKQIDKMAMDLGLPYNSQKRIESGIKYSIILTSYNGNTCVAKENLIKFVTDLLDVSKEEVEDSLINLHATKKIVIEKQDNEEWIYLYPFYKAEKNIAEKIKIMINASNNKYIKNIEKELKIQEEKLKTELSEKQKEAVMCVNENNICVITGGPRNWKNNNYKGNNFYLRKTR